MLYIPKVKFCLVLKQRLQEILDRDINRKTIAAVLVPILNEPDPKVVMIIRSKDLSRSAGHIAFPGGMIEHGETPVDTALREVEEELGLKKDRIEVIGFLSPREVRQYRIKICPVVGMVKGCHFEPDGREVSKVLIDSLKGVLKSRRITDWGPNFECAGQLVWGASSRVLDDLYLRIIKRYGSLDSFFE